MKGMAITALGALVLLAVLYLLVPGFLRCESAYIEDFAVSGDGKAMTLTLGVGSSVGHIRKVSAHLGEGGELRLDCLSAFGGINGAVGAGAVYTVPLEAEAQTICLYRNGGYEAVLEKDGSGAWRRIQ